nr:MAG TPA: hypothetical protein [Bacteriophage sp.]
MTTDNEARPIEELAKLDSYQGMTDEEIELLTDYKLRIALNDAAFKESMKQQQAATQAKIDAYAAEAEHAKKRLDALIAAPLNLTVMEGD